jgi:RNA polymerase sigma factor (sigma-70 family)
MAAAGSSLSPATGRSVAGSRTAELHANHCPAILRYCRSRLPSQEDAEDATQIVFMNAYRGLSNGVEPRSEAAWLFKIAERVVLSRRRALARRARVEFATDGQELGMVSQGDPDGARSDLFRLTDSLARIPDAQRRAIVLREWQGLPRQSIAAELGVSVGAVEKLILRARRALTEDLDRGARRRLSALASLAAWLRRYMHAGGVAQAAAGAASVAVLAAGTAHVLPAQIAASHTPARGVQHAQRAVRPSHGRQASSLTSAKLGGHRLVAPRVRATPAVLSPSTSGPSIAADDAVVDAEATAAPAASAESPTRTAASAPTVSAAVADVPAETAKAPPAGGDGPGRSRDHADAAPGNDARQLAAEKGSSQDAEPKGGDNSLPGLTDGPAPSHDQAPPAAGPPAADSPPGETDQPAPSHDQGPPVAGPPTADVPPAQTDQPGPPANGQSQNGNAIVPANDQRPHDELTS